MVRCSLSGAAPGHLAQLLSIPFFTFGLVVQKSLTEILAPPEIVAYQFTIAAAVMWCTRLALGGPVRFGKPELSAFAWGLLSPGMVLFLSTTGASQTDGASLVLIWGLLPLLVPLLGRVILLERVHWTLGLGCVICFAGVVCLVLGRQSAGESSVFGNVLILSAVAGAAISQIIGKVLSRSRGWYDIAVWQVTGAWAVTLLLAASDGEVELPSGLDVRILAAFIYLSVVMTALNFVAMNFALSRIPVAYMALYMSTSPIFGMCAAYILLGASLSRAELLGVFILVLGVALPHAYRLWGLTAIGAAPLRRPGTHAFFPIRTRDHGDGVSRC